MCILYRIIVRLAVIIIDLGSVKNRGFFVMDLSVMLARKVGPGLQDLQK